MELQECRAGVLVKEDYRVLARCEMAVEFPKDNEKAAQFYQKMANCFTQWAENILAKRAKEEYAALDDFWQKAKFIPYRFYLRGKALYTDERHITVVCESVYSHGAQRQVRRAAQVWHGEEKTILPMRQIIKKWCGKKPRKQVFPAISGCYPESDKIVFFHNPDQCSSFSEISVPFLKQK